MNTASMTRRVTVELHRTSYPCVTLGEAVLSTMIANDRRQRTLNHRAQEYRYPFPRF